MAEIYLGEKSDGSICGELSFILYVTDTEGVARILSRRSVACEMK